MQHYSTRLRMRRNAARPRCALSNMCTQRQTVHTAVHSACTHADRVSAYMYTPYHAIQTYVKACRTGGVFSGALVRGASRSSNGAVECGKLTTFKAMCTMRQLGEKVETHLYPNCAAFTQSVGGGWCTCPATRAVPWSKLPTFSCVHGFTFDVSCNAWCTLPRIKVAGVFALASHPGCHHLTFSAPLV
jgi:hypothetical protein